VDVPSSQGQQVMPVLLRCGASAGSTIGTRGDKLRSVKAQ
jgi:hypothetical protein